MAKNQQLTLEEAQALIDLKALILRVQANALGQLDPPMNQNELHSARLLIDKRMPNMQALQMDVSGDVEIRVLKVADHKPASE